MDIWEITAEPGDPGNLDKTLTSGQKVRITRMATYTYDVEIVDYLDVLDQPDITVKDLIRENEDEDGIRHNPGIVHALHNVDDVVIAVEFI